MTNSPYTFITGMGRSGTTFLSRLLSLDENFTVRHEFTGHREFMLASYYLGREYSKPFLEKEKARIDQARNGKNFIDVNGYLSDCTSSLNEVFDNPQHYHLVRNPLECCRSLLIRRDEKRMHKIPKTEKEVKDWLTASKLEQICINWRQTTEDLLQTKATLIRLEDLISDYHYLYEKLLRPLNLTISVSEYLDLKSKKVNRTRSQLYRFLYAKWKGKNYIPGSANYQLSDQEKQAVKEICGDTMKKIGF